MNETQSFSIFNSNSKFETGFYILNINLMKILFYILFKCNWVKIISLTSLIQQSDRALEKRTKEKRNANRRNFRKSETKVFVQVSKRKRE